MGHNDHLDDDRPDLPREAGRETEAGFEPDDEWLASAASELRQEAMRRWFLSRYCDPAIDTPYDSAELGYAYIHGGPFDADDELYQRFGDSCPDEEIRAVIDDLESDGITDWAPVPRDREDEYDGRFALELTEASAPLRRLRERLAQLQRILTLQGDATTQALARQLVFSGAIGVLEAYLYELASYWIQTDDKVLRALVEKHSHFRERRISLSELFERHAGIKKHAQGYLQNLVWHRWDKVRAVFQCALSVELPSTREFDAPLVKRHAIVHRSGHDNNGAPVGVTPEDIASLCLRIQAFAEELDAGISSRTLNLSPINNPAPGA